MSRKMKVDLGDEVLECNKIIANIQDDEEGDYFEQMLIGEWSLEELIDSRFYLDKLIEDKIYEKFSLKEKMLFDKIKNKEDNFRESFRGSLTKEERELYDKVNKRFKLVMEGDMSEVLSDDFEEVIDQLFGEVELQEEIEDENSKPVKDNVIDITHML